jgi:dUTP pyrophosphatase
MADPVLRVKRLCPDSVIPTRIESGSIGYDLHCTEQFDIEPTEIKAVNTGLSVHIPERFYGRISPKSGLALSGIDVLAGVIDNR